MTSIIQDLKSCDLIVKTNNIKSLGALLHQQKSPYTAVLTQQPKVFISAIYSPCVLVLRCFQ